MEISSWPHTGQFSQQAGPTRKWIQDPSPLLLMSKFLTLFRFLSFFFWTVQCVANEFFPRSASNLSVFSILIQVSVLFSLFDEGPSLLSVSLGHAQAASCLSLQPDGPTIAQTTCYRDHRANVSQTRHLPLSVSLTAPATQLGQLSSSEAKTRELA